MKIIILGAGQVGGNLAENLVSENHDIMLVDSNPRRLKELQDQLDIGAVVGCASYPNVLEQAGTENADMVIAVTASDEVNLIACQVAHTLFKVPIKIARIRASNYFAKKELFGKDDLPVDVFINPEKLVTDYVELLIQHPGTLQVLNFADGKIKLVAIKVRYGGHLVGKSLSSLSEFFPNIEFRIAAIFRQNKSIPLDGSTVILASDEIFFISASEHINSIMQALGMLDNPYKRIMIAGGGTIGFHLAERLSNSGNYQIKIIDQSKNRCQQLAENLKNITVLLGQVSDKRLLINENIEYIDVFCAVTNDDEANIMSCIQAKRLGVRRTMALISRTAYIDLIEGSGINIAISPQQASIGNILAYLRHGDVVNVHSLRRGVAEAIEAVVHKSSKAIGLSLAQIKAPKGATLGAIMRKGEVIIPHHDTIIKAGDHIIIFVSDKKHIKEVEKFFQEK
jgi:trk system potassium uptake protein